MKFLFFSLSLLCYQHSSACDSVYVRKIIDHLCSPKFSGRAYVKKGDKKSSQFIASEFQKIGLGKVNKSYFQNFPISVNTFPLTEITYNGKKLIPGIDFLVDPSSPTAYFSGVIEFIPIHELDTYTHYDIMGSKLKNAVIDTFTSKYFEEAAINYKKYSSDPGKNIVFRLSNDKLVWSSSSKVGKVCQIILRNELFDRHKPAHFEVKITNRFLNPYQSRNVIGILEGKEFKDSFIVLTAHYDHLGLMGKTAMFPGANDNASGIAMLLSLAKYFKEHPQKYSIVFIAFSGEETGLVGSKYFVDHPLIPLGEIRFLVNLDLMGNGSDGVMAVNGSLHKAEFETLKSINDSKNYLPEVKSRGRAANSDHYWFSQAGVPAFFFYLMGPYPHYHDVNDKSKALPLYNFENAFFLFRDFIQVLQN